MTELLDMPAEVRVMIYGLLFPSEVYDLDDPESDESIPNVHTGTISVNTQLALETLPLLYSQIKFHILPNRDAVKWLRRMEQTNRDLLRTVICDFTSIDDDRCVRELFGLLSRCSNISLTLIMGDTRELKWMDSSVFELFRGMHGFASVSVDLKPDSNSTCPGGHNPQASCEVLQRRLDNGIRKMQSPCPPYCYAHRGQSRHAATASLRLTFLDKHCLTCTGRILGETWQSSHSVFQL